jgi:hypothetical protein
MGISSYFRVDIKRPASKPCHFVGSSRKDLKRFPVIVRNRIGFALRQVQECDEPFAAKALKGFGGRTILELVDDFDSDTDRTRLHRAVCRDGIRAARSPKESKKRYRHSSARHRVDQVAPA